MFIKVDNCYLYLKVIEWIKEDIKNGIYIEKEKFFFEFEFLKLMGVSWVILCEVLCIFEEEYVIIRRYGVGIFVYIKLLFFLGIE